MYYFKFTIGKNVDGTRVTYSPGWHGEMPHCPKDVTVLLYNDAEGWGLAQTEDKITQKEIQEISKDEADKVLVNVKDEDEVYFGEKLANRWNPKVEIEAMVDEPGEVLLNG